MKKLLKFLPHLFYPQSIKDSTVEYKTHGKDYLFIPPHQSVRSQFSRETLLLTVASIVAVVGVFFAIAFLTKSTPLVVLVSFFALLYFFLIFFKLLVVQRAMKTPFLDVSDEEIKNLRDEDLPVYTVIVPLRDEAEVMHQIVGAMSAIDYPTEKLNLIITVEEYDTDTLEAIERVGIPTSWSVCVLPDTLPKTKPKALNVAFLEAKGEFLVIYDAEIIPDRNQLKKAFLVFLQHPEYQILQPRLDHYNTDQNVITQMFTTEFTFYYDLFLSGLVSYDFPTPLSGHSTHFRMEALRNVGAWDPYNVAEDCEIGIRLFRHGYRAGAFNSISLEEAASDVRGWVAQRTRWMKGFIQTSIAHLRYPLETKRELGSWKNFIIFLVLVPVSVLINFMNVVSWGMFLWWMIAHPDFIKSLYPTWVLYVSVAGFTVGSFVFTYLNLVALWRREKFHLIRWWFLTPFYWGLLAYASARAVVQIFKDPYVWEKTSHGKHLAQTPAQTPSLTARSHNTA